MFCLIQYGLSGGVTSRAFRTTFVFTSVARTLNVRYLRWLCISQSLVWFSELSSVRLSGLATISISGQLKRNISVSNKAKAEMPSNKKNKIPDRWMDYQAVGKRIPGTRFITFKVPLKQSLMRCLPPSETFGPLDLIHLLVEEKEELGLIIDLTFTTRYYSPTDLPDSVQYQKIFTTGHRVPNDPTILSFKKAVYRFLRENDNNDKLIGVHCTHGLNRTGYLVCRYLIDVEGMVPRRAVDLFNASRGHSIERKNYLDDLLFGRKRRNDGMEVPEEDPVQGSAGCCQASLPVSKCSPFNKSVHQSQSFPGGPVDPPLPQEMRPVSDERDLIRPLHPTSCSVSSHHSGMEQHNSSHGVALSEHMSSSLQGSGDKPLPREKPKKKRQRHRKNKGNRS